MPFILYAMKKKTTPFFGSNLKRLRIENGLSQTELGQKVGLSKRMIVYYENESESPPVERVAALAKALNVKIDALLKNDTKIFGPTVDPKFARKLEKAKKLPSVDQKLLSTMIDSLLKK